MSLVLNPYRYSAAGGGAGAPGNSWVTNGPLGVYRNNYSGWVGVQFTVGGSDIDVTHIARWVINGSTGTREVAIWNATGSTKLASASLDLSAFSDEWGWEPLSYTLSASTTYRLVSLEVSGGAQWHDSSSGYTTTSAATLIRSAYGSPSPSIGYSTGRMYVPVTFGYA